MIYKHRTKPETLVIREHLVRRMTFSPEEQELFTNQASGFTGEIHWDQLTVQLKGDCLLLNDLRLEVMGTTFQIDALLLLGNKIYLYEVKNFKGDYYYADGKLFLSSGTEIKNPFQKLLETTSSLRRLLQQMGYSYQIEAAVVFVNPSFSLYQAQKDLPVLFLSQLDYHFQKLNRIRSPLSSDMRRLASDLTERHMPEFQFEKRPVYHYSQLQKGAVCSQCGSFALFEKGYQIACSDCDHLEWPAQTVLRCAKELQLLFPDQKLTTSALQEWCQVIKSPQVIRRALKKNFVSKGNSSGRYYE